MEIMNLDNLIDEELSSRPHAFTSWVKLKQDIHCNGAFNGARLGAYSLTTADRKNTFISTYHQWCGQPASAASVARLALKHSLTANKRKRFEWNRANLDLLDLPQPLYCASNPGEQYLVYVDIKSAYYSIYSRLPALLYYSSYGAKLCGDRLGFLLPDDLKNFKLARNCLIGCMRARSGLLVRDKKIVSVPVRNALISPSHWGLIATLLHTLAHYAISFGAIYYNTDGAIFTSDEDATKWADFVGSLNLQTSIKAQGMGYCWGVGRYSIGKGKLEFRPPCLPFSNLIEVNEGVLDLWTKMQ